MPRIPARAGHTGRPQTLRRASEIIHCCWRFNKQLLLRMLWNERRRDHQISLKEGRGYKAACCVSQERRSSKGIVKQPPSGVSPWAVALRLDWSGGREAGSVWDGTPRPQGLAL